MNNNTTPVISLQDKAVIITGSSKGIGLSIATMCLQAGAKVLISGRNEEELTKVAEKLSHSNLFYTKCHVGSESDRNHLVSYAIEKMNKIDVLINNAAINPAFGSIQDQNELLFDKIMEVNVKAAFSLSNAVFPHMEKTGGSIIHISSVESRKPSPGLALYSVSKAALSMLSKTQAKEWGKYNIRVNAILPGLIKTKFSAAIWQNENFLKSWTAQLPLQRMAEPEEIAGLAVFLASDASSYCTGGEYVADGGYLI